MKNTTKWQWVGNWNWVLISKTMGESCGSNRNSWWIWDHSIPLDPSHLRLTPSAKLINKHYKIPINPNCYTNFVLIIMINFAKWYFLNKHNCNLSAIFFPSRWLTEAHILGNYGLWPFPSCKFITGVISHYFQRYTRCDKHRLMNKHLRRPEGCRQENWNITKWPRITYHWFYFPSQNPQ